MQGGCNMFTQAEEQRYLEARKSYNDIKQNKAKLPEKGKRLFEQLEAVEIGRYDVDSHTILMIANVYQNNAINAFNTIFRLGFLKGMRKAKKEFKKK